MNDDAIARLRSDAETVRKTIQREITEFHKAWPGVRLLVMHTHDPGHVVNNLAMATLRQTARRDTVETDIAILPLHAN